MIRLQATGGQKSEPPRNKFLATPFTIVIDTREQTPWYFGAVPADKDRNWLPLIERYGLKTGDYSIKGHEDQFCIERKSLPDLYGSISAGRDRFEAEHDRMRQIVDRGGTCCVIVESSLADAIERPPLETSVHPRVLLGTCASWFVRYRVPWFFPGPCRTAELLAFQVIEKFHKQLTAG